ncbi:steroid receptor RNA activator 1-like [Phymastichus coffea]|uniref:steroid receptor RNA activator 1-like n=1 Tax=Phymastichus coffea TaxID=108790 RepID=UPI00273C5573|nr:steroid receptor RNA activator 1-like [Phymastichus coffea]
MEDKPEEVISTQKKLQSSHDPGWNDPPSWAFTPSPTATSGTPTKRLLNKRVAFPLNSKPETASTLLHQTIPPVGLPPPTNIGSLTTAPHKPFVAPTNAQIGDSTSNWEMSKEDALKNTLENLRCLTKELEASKTEEIERRLERMESMWNEDKLNNDVHKKVLEISQALKDNDAEKADQLHVSLMMNNASMCSSWIPGLRQLITELKSMVK